MIEEKKLLCIYYYKCLLYSLSICRSWKCVCVCVNYSESLSLILAAFTFSFMFKYNVSLYLRTYADHCIKREHASYLREIMLWFKLRGNRYKWVFIWNKSNDLQVGSLLMLEWYYWGVFMQLQFLAPYQNYIIVMFALVCGLNCFAFVDKSS